MPPLIFFVVGGSPAQNSQISKSFKTLKMVWHHLVCLGGVRDSTFITVLQSQHPSALPKSFLGYSYWGKSTDTSLYCSPGTDMNSHHVPATCLLQKLVHKSLPCHAFIYLCLWCIYALPNYLHQKLFFELWQHQHVIHHAGMMPWNPFRHCLSSSCAINNNDCQLPSFQPHIY